MVIDQGIDARAKTKWKKAGISYKNYQEYIDKKDNRFDLSIIDLLYISNFKGGNATINEKQSDINYKLSTYSEKLIEINREFGRKNLVDLTGKEIVKLGIIINSICYLTSKESIFRIDGFSISYLSALLNVYFPNLIPILDRRVLINSFLVESKDISSQGQIKNLNSFFLPLIIFTFKQSKMTGLTLREIDEKYFIQKLKIK